MYPAPVDHRMSRNAKRIRTSGACRSSVPNSVELRARSPTCSGPSRTASPSATIRAHSGRSGRSLEILPSDTHLADTKRGALESEHDHRCFRVGLRQRHGSPIGVHPTSRWFRGSHPGDCQSRPHTGPAVFNREQRFRRRRCSTSSSIVHLPVRPDRTSRAPSPPAISGGGPCSNGGPAQESLGGCATNGFFSKQWRRLPDDQCFRWTQKSSVGLKALYTPASAPRARCEFAGLTSPA